MGLFIKQDIVDLGIIVGNTQRKLSLVVKIRQAACLLLNRKQIIQFRSYLGNSSAGISLAFPSPLIPLR